MNGIDMFLVQFGLFAIFVIFFIKAVGVPIPIPANVIILATAAQAAEGKFVLWQAFLVILLAVILGGLIQFMLVRGPGRNLLYRFGRYIGLTTARLDAAAVKIKKGYCGPQYRYPGARCSGGCNCCQRPRRRAAEFLCAGACHRKHALSHAPLFPRLSWWFTLHDYGASLTINIRYSRSTRTPSPGVPVVGSSSPSPEGCTSSVTSRWEQRLKYGTKGYALSVWHCILPISSAHSRWRSHFELLTGTLSKQKEATRWQKPFT